MTRPVSFKQPRTQRVQARFDTKPTSTPTVYTLDFILHNWLVRYKEKSQARRLTALLLRLFNCATVLIRNSEAGFHTIIIIPKKSIEAGPCLQLSRVVKKDNSIWLRVEWIDMRKQASTDSSVSAVKLENGQEPRGFLESSELGSRLLACITENTPDIVRSI